MVAPVAIYSLRHWHHLIVRTLRRDGAEHVNFNKKWRRCPPRAQQLVAPLRRQRGQHMKKLARGKRRGGPAAPRENQGSRMQRTARVSHERRRAVTNRSLLGVTRSAVVRAPPHEDHRSPFGPGSVSWAVGVRLRRRSAGWVARDPRALGTGGKHQSCALCAGKARNAKKKGESCERKWRAARRWSGAVGAAVHHHNFTTIE